jgi:hypothetical protein
MTHTAKTKRRRAWFALFAAFAVVYVAMGVLATAAGKSASWAWLKPLPPLLGPLIGTVAFRIHRHRAGGR